MNYNNQNMTPGVDEKKLLMAHIFFNSAIRNTTNDNSGTHIAMLILLTKTDLTK